MCSKSFAQTKYEWWFWGSNSNYMLGIGNNPSGFVYPTKSNYSLNINKVFAAAFHTYAIDSNSNLYSWGGNGIIGTLGLNSNKMYFDSPQKVENDNDWLKISSNDEHTIGLKKDKTLWAWGRNTIGQLGTGNYQSQIIPKMVNSLKIWKDISTGWQHSIALKNDSSIWIWGNNTFGELGLGLDSFNFNIPHKIDLNKWIKICAAANTSFGIQANGKLWCWGKNTLALGLSNQYNNDSVYFRSPHEIDNSTDWVDIVSSGTHTIALKKDGSIWSWGFNDGGQLGLDNYNNTAVPTKIGTQKDWVKIFVGSASSYAIKANGTLWGWGENRNWQLGLGSQISIVSKPTQIGTDSNWVELSCGALNVFAKRSIKNICNFKINSEPSDVAKFSGFAFFKLKANDTMKKMQWQTNLGTGWINLNNAGQYDRTNTDSLTVKNISLSNDGQLFRCIVFGVCGKDTTREAKLSVWGVGTNKMNNSKFSIHPNPVKNILKVEGLTNFSYRIETLTGQSILAGNTNENINTELLPTGVYILNISNQKVKFIKE